MSRWIRKALMRHGSKSGALHRELGVPKGKKIPAAKLRKAAKKPGKLGRRARFALTMRKIARRRKKRHGKKTHHRKKR